MTAKWKQLETYLKKVKKEDAPTVSIAKGGVDFNPTGLSKKKKKELDGRTTAYKLHRRKLEAQREKRKRLKATLCGSFREDLENRFDEFKEPLEELSPADKNQKKIAIDTIMNPDKSLLGGLIPNEAEKILKTKFKFTDQMIKKLKEDNVATLKNIVKRKQAMPLKFKDGQMKVDLYTASAFVQTLDNKNIKPDTKKKLEFIINKGNKAGFLKIVDVIFK